MTVVVKGWMTSTISLHTTWAWFCLSTVWANLPMFHKLLHWEAPKLLTVHISLRATAFLHESSSRCTVLDDSKLKRTSSTPYSHLSAFIVSNKVVYVTNDFYTTLHYTSRVILQMLAGKEWLTTVTVKSQMDYQLPGWGRHRHSIAVKYIHSHVNH